MRRRHAVGLALLLLGTVVLRLPGAREPLERDLTTYAYVAHEMLSGRTLYRDVWDHKPPAVYLSFAAAEAVAGYRQLSVTLLGIVTAAASLLVLFDTLRRTAGPRAALLGGTLWALAANSVALQANQPNVEVFLNLCTLAATWAFVRALEGSRGWHLVAGAALALATTYKTIAAFAVALLAGWAALAAPSGKGLAGRARAALAVALPTPVVWLATAAAFLALGAFVDLWDAVIVFNRDYAGSVLANLWGFLTPAAFPRHKALADVAVLVPCSLLWALCGRARAVLPGSLVAALAVATLLQVAAPGRLYAHYYQLALPLLCLLTALLLEDVLSACRSARRPSARWLAGGLVGGVLLALALPQLRYARMHPDEISRRKYGDTFVEARAVAEEVRALTAPGESVFEWGQESGIYSYSQRRAATAMVSIAPLFVGPPERRDRRWERLVEEVVTSGPALFVYNARFARGERGFFRPYLDHCYDLATTAGSYTLYRRRAPTPPACAELFPRHRFRPEEPLSLAVSPSSPCRVLAGRVVTRAVTMPGERCVVAGPMLRVGSGGELHLTATETIVLRNGFSVTRGGALSLGHRPTTAP